MVPLLGTAKRPDFTLRRSHEPAGQVASAVHLGGLSGPLKGGIGGIGPSGPDGLKVGGAFFWCQCLPGSSSPALCGSAFFGVFLLARLKNWAASRSIPSS